MASACCPDQGRLGLEEALLKAIGPLVAILDFPLLASGLVPASFWTGGMAGKGKNLS